MLRRLKTIVFCSFLVVALFACHPVRADLILAVDFDLNQAGIQSDAIVDGNGQTTASIVLFLTETTDLYAYKFSVRFNSDRLTLVSKDDTPPSVNGKTFIEELTLETSVSGSGGGFVNYTEIQRFDGKIPADPMGNDQYLLPADVPAGGVVLGSLTFNVIGSGDDLLVLPGEFEQPQPGDVNPLDIFLGSNGRVTTTNSFQGGFIVAIPEPSSILLVASVVVMFWVVRKRLPPLPKVPK